MATKSKSSVMMALALALSSMALMIDLAIYPAADAIYTVYADYNQVLVNFIITGPSLLVIFSSIIGGFMTQVMSKKTMLICSYVVFLIATVCAPLVDSIYYLLAMRFIAGFTVGLISVSSMGLIAELFVDEARRSRVTGIYTGLMCLLGALMSFAAGYLALGGWTHIFRVYWIALPILILIIFFVPKTPPEGKKTAEAEDASAVPEGKTHWSRPIALAVAAFIFNAMYAVILTMFAVFLAEEGIGDTATAGTMSSITTLGSMVCCFLFGVIFMRTKRATPVVFAVLEAVGFFMITGSHAIPVLAVAVFIMGAMYGLSYSYYLCYASLIVPPSKASLSIGIANAAVYAGLFVGPYVCPTYESVFGLSTMGQCMPFLGATCIAYAVLSVIVILATRKRRAAEEAEQAALEAAAGLEAQE